MKFQIVVGVLAAIAFAVFWFMGRDDADTAKVGDCLKSSGNDINPDLQVVDCGGTEAAYKVVSVHNDTTDWENLRRQGRHRLLRADRWRPTQLRQVVRALPQRDQEVARPRRGSCFT
ncbi:hypothetical protein [Streptomyces peucetius]|uniref:Secreted protein n=1 Tax=Streptomyces peucetius TaxID=1950 RepID=A0ABY6I8E7_STRPE|nr:hypothetical protein [Streptomyces peucetius]UYQ63271.1 hypothetical protein OGH68_18550 [Streptomyces peucetius]